MNHGSLFSGIGGFDLASEWMGWENIFHCEIEEFPRKILNHYWPDAISYEDIKKTDFSIHNGQIDILTGGFPCQPYSQAGKRLGKEDERHLWPEMLRAITEIKPTWVVGENVYGIVNWNGGMVFEEVQADLEAEGYEVQPYILPAAAVNAPHQRYRVWFVAYSAGKRRNNRCNHRQERYLQDNINGDATEDQSERDGRECRSGQIGNIRNAPNTKSKQSERLQPEQRNLGEQEQRESGRINSEMGNANVTDTGIARREERYVPEITDRQGYRTGCDNEIRGSFENFPTQSPVCSRDDGLSTRLDGITFPKWRNESIKGYGNAIVPQVALQIFKAIEEYERI